MRNHLLSIFAVFTLAGLSWRPAYCDATTEAELRQALQNSTAQIATLDDQVAHLQAAQAPQAAQIKALQAVITAQEAQAGHAAANQTAAPNAGQAKLVAALNRQLAARSVQLGKSRAAYLQADSAAGVSAVQNARLAAQGEALRAQIMGCDKKNAALYTLAGQILDAYSHKDDVFGTIANREPFIGFKRVQLQNIVQNEQDKLFDDQISATQSSP